MKWRSTKAGVPGSWVRERLVFHELIADDNELVAWVREDVKTGEVLGQMGYPDLHQVFPTVKEAKAYIIATLVAERLDES